MNIDEIISRREELDKELRIAASTMEKKDNIIKIRTEILKNQRACPHFSSKYDWAVIDGVCPYCGFQLTSKERDY